MEGNEEMIADGLTKALPKQKFVRQDDRNGGHQRTAESRKADGGLEGQAESEEKRPRHGDRGSIDALNSQSQSQSEC